jgi:hypothetical protein
MAMETRAGSLFLVTLFGWVFQTGAETILYREDFSHFQSGSEGLCVVESGHPDFPHALELRSIKKEDGKIRQGHWQLPLGKTTQFPQCVMKSVSDEQPRVSPTLVANDNSHKAVTVIQTTVSSRAKSAGWGGKDPKIKSPMGINSLPHRFSRGVFDVFVATWQKAV